MGNKGSSSSVSSSSIFRARISSIRRLSNGKLGGRGRGGADPEDAGGGGNNNPLARESSNKRLRRSRRSRRIIKDVVMVNNEDITNIQVDRFKKNEKGSG